MNSFSPLTQEKLKYYVYLLKTPGQTVFYVGKGIGNRVFSHVNDALESPHSTDKLDLIRDIHKDGGKVQYTIIRHGMTEDQAFEVEAALIDLYHLDDLKNEVKGHGCDRGLCSAQELDIRYGATPAVIDDPVFLGWALHFVPDQTTPDQLYQDTRSSWLVRPDRHPDAKYALSIYNMIIREVYVIDGWDFFPVPKTGKRKKDRYEFVGHVAPDEIRDKYLYKDISSYIVQEKTSKKTGLAITVVNQNLKWVNC